MDEGIIKKEEIAEFLVNDGYEPFNVFPVACIPTGDQMYGLASKDKERNYLGLHIMDTNDCLEHPDWRPRVQVIKKRFTEDLEEIPLGEKTGSIFLDSFELWKFITLYTKGSAVTYELLYMPTIHCDPGAEYLFSLMREGVTNRIGKTARDYALHVWRKDRLNRKKTVMTFYRLMQAICFLREEDFHWNIDMLLEYLQSRPQLTLMANVIINNYRAETYNKTPVEQSWITSISEEISGLIDEVDRAGVSTKLPDQVPNHLLIAIREKIKETRLRMI